MNKKVIQNFLLSLLIPCIACGIQWFFWDQFQPFIWFLFYPAVFFSAQIGGLWSGLAATILSIFLATFFFVEPAFSFTVLKSDVLYSVMVFGLMGFLFSNLQERFKSEQQKLLGSESALRKMNEGLEGLVNERALEIQKSEQRFQSLFEYMLEGAQIIGFDWRYLYLNNTAEKHNRRPNSELIGGKYMEMWPGIETTNVFAVIKHCMDERAASIMENKFIFPDGKVGWFALSIQPVPEGVFILSFDITERKLAEEALRQSEEKFSTLFEKAGFAIALSTLPDGVIIDVNETFERIFGFTRQEAQGRTSLELGINPDAEGRERLLAALKEHGFVRDQEVTLRVKSGEPRIMSVNMDLVNIGDQKYALNMTQDITERKRAEKDLVEQQARTSGIINSAMDAIISVDAGQRILIFNPAAEVMFRCEQSRAIGQPIEQFLPERFRSNHVKHIQHFSDTGITSRGMGQLGTVYGLRSDNEEFPVEASISQIQIAGQSIFTVILRDITERKHAEENLRRSNTELEQFAYVASHDLQEPLRAVAGMVQLLGQRYKGRLDENADEYINHAVDASRRMQSLINDLLDYSRVDRLGKSFEPTDLERSLKTALDNLQVTIRESGARITHDPLPTIMADPGQMIQVLQNLIGNSIKFRGERPLQIHIGVEKIENACRIAIRDNGIGIEPQYFERIFLVFQRLHTRREYPGTGIGLSLCKKIVERHGGRIWVESQPERGSIFYFTIEEKKHESK